ncbi:hypothetical protein WJX72_006378 [[Myrmecia] bisecta]|uniref:Uncharacterized protein n=1 Tax=[Myrmecia] bisecta TaxID=41462 RepID=A0AAW1P6W0_9CHLO
MGEEPDVTVEVYKGEALIATKLFGSPATAGEVKQGLVEKNATWRGDLTPHNSSTGLVGQRKLKGGAVYRLRLQEQPGDPIDYEIEAVPFDQFDFAADVPILRLPSYMLKWARLQASGSDFIQPADANHPPHSVLHEVLSKLAPLEGSSRDEKTSSGHGPARLDVTYADPAIVLSEEKATNTELKTAADGIITKWARIANYEDIPFVVCFALANDLIQAFTLSMPQKVKEREVKFDLSVEVDQVRCVKAILNVARLCKHVRQHGPLQPPRLAFNMKHSDARRDLTLTYTCVEKLYKQMPVEAACTLLDFYKETHLVRFLEKGILVDRDDLTGKNAFRLSPVG